MREIHGDACNLEDLFLRVKPYVGRYALIYKDDKNTMIVQDAISLREVYYFTEENRVICGSQPNLIAKYADPSTPARNDKEFREYFAKNSINKKWNPHQSGLVTKHTSKASNICCQTTILILINVRYVAIGQVHQSGVSI